MRKEEDGMDEQARRERKNAYQRTYSLKNREKIYAPRKRLIILIMVGKETPYRSAKLF